MRIAQVCPAFYPQTGGVETHVYEISKRLAGEFEVDILTTVPVTRFREIKKVEEMNGFTVRRFMSFAPFGAYYFSPSLYGYLKKNAGEYDIIHAHNYHAFPALFAALTKRKKLVFTPHYHGRGGSLFRSFLLKPYRFAGSTIFRKAEVVVCVSEYEKELVKRDFGVNAVVIPNGVDMKKINAAKPFKSFDNFILYVGRIEKYKNLDVLVKSMKYLADMKLCIAGKGSFEKELRKIAEKAGVENRVKFLGFVGEEEKYRWLKTCSVFVNLSQAESFGITVLEALACGKPAVVGGESALKEFAEKFDCVFVPDELSPEAVAEAVLKASEIKVDLDLSEYDWDVIAAKIADVYVSLL